MKIAFIGSRGIPASYSGFETFYEQLSTRLVQRGHSVTVYNRSHWIKSKDKTYKNVSIVRLPSIKTKHLDTITHTFLSLIHSLFCNYDLIYICIVGNSPLCFIPKLFKIKVILNVDGTDATREKWGWFARHYMFWTERIACRLADIIIADSMVIQEKYKERYQRDTIFIPYGANICDRALVQNDNTILQKFGLEPDKYILFVSRLEPENNAHTLIESFKRLKTKIKLVIVGDSPYNHSYKQKLQGLSDERVIFTGFVYGDGYKALSCNCLFFVLPAGIDGTRPVLLDQLGFGNCVLVNDNLANMEVVGNAGLSFDGKAGCSDLGDKINFLLDHQEAIMELRSKAQERIKLHFSWDKITENYESLFAKLAKGDTLF